MATAVGDGILCKLGHRPSVCTEMQQERMQQNIRGRREDRAHGGCGSRWDVTLHALGTFARTRPHKHLSALGPPSLRLTMHAQSTPAAAAGWVVPLGRILPACVVCCGLVCSKAGAAGTTPQT